MPPSPSLGKNSTIFHMDMAIISCTRLFINNFLTRGPGLGLGVEVCHFGVKVRVGSLVVSEHTSYKLLIL